MSEVDDKITRNRNMLYYNQLVKNDRKAHIHEQTKGAPSKKKSFASKKVELKDFAPVPEGWEYFVYTFYVVAVPYILGAIFLFFAVAGGDFGNFMLLDLNAFPIVWLIGYEITSVILLCWILILYLQYEDEETFY
jgi:hypothetical protein